MAADWAQALAPVEEQIAAMGRFLRAEVAAGRDYLPAGRHVLRVFSRPLAEVKVLVVGQDPYPTPGHPVGLSFSVAPDVAPPRSLVNIFKELVDDLGVAAPTSGDLTPWADAGVMLLNRCLTVTPGASASHRGRGWEAVTDQAIRSLASRARAGAPLTAILWGRDAQSLKADLAPIPWVESVHPSPLSAHRGFFGSRPFSRVEQAAGGAGRYAGGLAPEADRRDIVADSTNGEPMSPRSTTTPSPHPSDQMPALYLGHGAPPLLDDPVWSAQLVALAAGSRDPRRS